MVSLAANARDSDAIAPTMKASGINKIIVEELLKPRFSNMVLFNSYFIAVI
ncbi:MAG: hypothetical protein NPMRD1_290016 [Nitrosopumilales archaeon]|nr:MAG: hypothetical protein NPMRD1_290016 [Nitrosopumilales archaeon]